MTALNLARREPTKRMARFYRLDVQPDLFGGWSLWREWGRIGQPGRVRVETFPTAGAAELAQAKVLRAKAGRGYTLRRGSAGGPCSPATEGTENERAGLAGRRE